MAHRFRITGVLNIQRVEHDLARGVRGVAPRRVGLDVASVGGDALGDAIGADGGGNLSADRGAGIDDLLVEARRRPEQFADRRRPESLRPAAAEEKVLNRLPVRAGLERLCRQPGDAIAAADVDPAVVIGGGVVRAGFADVL